MPPMPPNVRALELDEPGVLRVRGPDAVRFLQGQLSNDVTRLSLGRSLLAGYHNPQGRVIALLRLWQAAPEEILAVLPRELLPSVHERLRRFVLRAKVTLSDESERWSLYGWREVDSSPAAPAPRAANGALIEITRSPSRWLHLAPRNEAHALVPEGALQASGAAARRLWTLLDIASGLPQIHVRTSEAFVAQMLNLDLLDAIDFAKGCYTGQEVIARAHYRGRVKRRMQRWRTLEPAQLTAGDAGELADGRRFKVVEAARLDDGCCEFLAVAALAGAQQEPPESEPDGRDAGAGTTTAAPLRVQALELPYSLP